MAESAHPLRTQQKSLKLWNKDFLLLLTIRFFTSSVFTGLNAVMYVYVVQTYGTDGAIAGIAVGGFILFALISRMFAGALMTVMGGARLLLFGSAMYLIVGLMYFVPVGAVPFIVIRCLHGTAFGILNNTVTSVVASTIPHDRRGEGLGYLSMTAAIIQAVAPFLILHTLSSFGFFAVFALCNAFSIVPLVLVKFLDLQPSDTTLGTTNIVSALRLHNLIEVKAIPMSLVAMLVNIGSSSIGSFIYAFSEAEGGSDSVTVYFFVYAITMLLVRPPMGKFQDRHGCNALMYPCIALYSCSFIVLAFHPSLLGFILTGILSACGYSGTFPCAQVASLKNVSESRIGIATSTFFVFADLGMGLGPVIHSVTTGAFGFTTMYLICAAFELFVFPLYRFADLKSDKREHAISNR